MKHKSFTRREALKGIASAGAIALARPSFALPPEAPILVSGHPVEVVLTAVSSHTIRVTVQPLQDGQPQSVPVDGALVKEKWGLPLARLRELSGTRSVTSGNLEVKISANPLPIRVETKSGRLVQELKVDGTSGTLDFRLGDGPLLGLGQGGPQFDRRGNVEPMVSGQRGYELSTHGSRVPIQLLIGTSGWGLYVHHPLGAFNLSGEEGQLEPHEAQATLPLDVFVINAEDPVTLPREYAKITGFAEMPPVWSLGYQQSHRTLGTPEEILQEAKIFRKKKLPCDTLIYLGTGFCPEGWNTDNGEFAWNSKAFPNPSGALQQFHDEHFKVALHVVVEGHHLTGTVADPCTAPPLPSGWLPNGHWPPDRQVSCYWPWHKLLVDMGVDGWWPDQGDGFDAASHLARNRMYFEGQQMYRPNRRVYALHRNGYAGMQRYASFLWSGDIDSSWETLRTHIPNAINTGLSGIPYWGTDIGGFVPTQEYTGELYVRWFQFGAFNPLFRSHGRDWRLHLPWGWNTGKIGFPETRRFHPDPAELHNAAVEPICRKYLELRYQLMPYLYSAVQQTCDTGLPVIRALWLHYPEDATAVARRDEYLYGRDRLVAPVAEKGAGSRSLYLPRGTWYDFWTQTKLEGGREITRNVDLATIPLYVRAGAVLPMDPVRQYTGEQVDGPLTLWIYRGLDGTTSLYEDEGETFEFHRGQCMHIDIEWKDSPRQISLRLRKGYRMLAPEKRKIQLRIAGEPTVRHIIFEGRPVSMRV
ncbi:MAG: TIM-barrel domain-containing protein [Acidobacteriaceae bacterium]